MTGEYRRKNWDTGDSKSIFWKNTREKLQEHTKKIDVKSINRYRWMWNFIQQHDQTRSIWHQTYPIRLSIDLCIALRVNWLTTCTTFLFSIYFSILRGSCVKGIIFYHLERTLYGLSLGGYFTNWSVIARFAHLETIESKLNTPLQQLQLLRCFCYFMRLRKL